MEIVTYHFYGDYQSCLPEFKTKMDQRIMDIRDKYQIKNVNNNNNNNNNYNTTINSKNNKKINYQTKILSKIILLSYFLGRSYPSPF